MTAGDGVLLRIVAPHFVAGLVVGQRAAPIVGYMAGWSLDDVYAYAKRRGWRVEHIGPTRIALRNSDPPEWHERFVKDSWDMLRWAALQGEADVE